MNKNYTEVIIEVTDTTTKEVLIAGLADLGFDGFEETDTNLKAFTDENNFEQAALTQFLQEANLPYTQELVAQQNWNALWESNFEPVRVRNFVGVRAHFHEAITDVQHEIVITPKMSFGTGHHATTYSVMELMENIDFKAKSVFDFGTGTGILAILAEKLGSTKILAIDYDSWCIENANENVLANQCTHITIQQADTAKTAEQFDVVIANINKHIILDNLTALSAATVAKGIIILSGLLSEDEKDILEATKKIGWKHQKTTYNSNWIAISFIKTHELDVE